MKVRHFLLILLGSWLIQTTSLGQCHYENTAFNGGEFLTYNLYYNWKFVWVKAGTASMSLVNSTYKGKKAYRASLITRGSSQADEFFVMRDTLLSYCDEGLAPLYYRKGAREGKRYYVDEVFYSYANGKSQLRQHEQSSKGEHKWTRNESADCVYDMLNMFLRARSFDPSDWTAGKQIIFPLADGNGIDKAALKYRGKTNVKADNGKKYRCLQLSYMEQDKGKWKEVVRFYVTDDSNHIPVRLDMFLRFGSAKAFLVGMKGASHPLEAEL